MILNDRQREIVAAALSYAAANLDDLNEALACPPDATIAALTDCLYVQAHYINRLEADEVSKLLADLARRAS